MGAKSTYSIDRQTAIAVIVGRLSQLGNEQITAMLEGFDESEGRNYQICEDTHDSPFSINSIDEFYTK